MGWIYELAEDSPNMNNFEKECLVIADRELTEVQLERAKLDRELQELRIENLELRTEIRRLRRFYKLHAVA